MAEWFKKDTYLKAYQFLVNPIRGRQFRPISEEGPLEAPMVRRMLGGPVKRKSREPLEGKNKSQTKLSREGRVMRCKICRAERHNRICCPQRINTIS